MTKNKGKRDMGASTARTKYTIDPVRMRLSWLENPFPVSADDEIYKSWHIWVDRIKQGQSIEQATVAKITEGMPDNEAENWAEDWHIAEVISNEMFGALTVAMVAATEAHYYRCMCICEVAGKSKPNFDSVFQYAKVVKYFKRAISVNIEKLPHSTVVKALRTLANSYKHSSGRYGTSKRGKIDVKLATAWGLSEGRPIMYNSLPFRDISFACGEYCEALSVSVRSAVLPPSASPAA